MNFVTSNKSDVPEIDFLPDFVSSRGPRVDHVCEICAESAVCRHFGAFCCSACAAFFRRAVSRKHTFSCTLGGDCSITSGQFRRHCAACRMKKCIQAGMKKTEVLSLGTVSARSKNRSVQTNTPTPILPKIQKFDHNPNFSTFQNTEWLRSNVLLNQAIGYHRIHILQSSQPPFQKASNIPDTAKQILHESRFCQMYLNAVGIMDYAKDVVDENITDIIYYWNYLTVILHTLRNDSLKVRKMVTLDLAIIEMSEEAIKTWYATEQRFHRHLDVIVKNGTPLLYRVEALMKEIVAIGMTTEEQSFFLVLGMIEIVTRQTTDPISTKIRFKPLLDTLFCSMHRYYLDNFTTDVTAIRMGRLILSLSIMNEINILFTEHRALINLCGGHTSHLDAVSLLRAFRSKFPDKTETS